MEFTEVLGIEVIRLEGGECVLELELRPDHMSYADRAHGGVLFSLLDTAMGRAILSDLPAGRGCATIEAKLNYFRPVQLGRLRSEAKVINRSRNIAYAEGSIVDSAGKLVARSTGTFMLTETLQQGERERV